MPEKKIRNPLAGKRRKAREFALLGVYESIINPEADFAAIDANLVPVMTDEEGPMAGCELTGEDFKDCDREFYAELLQGVLAERGKLDALLETHLDRDPAKLSVIEHACLLIGAWELSHCLQNPYRVVINEAVELSKQFGSDKGYKLVNGVLDKVAAQVRPQEEKAAQA